MQEALLIEVVSIAELIPSHVQKVFARLYHESRTITPAQLDVAVESHAGHGEGAEVELSAASAAVARVPPLLRRRWRRRRCCQQQCRASMARNRQVPRRSGRAIGVASEVILRETAWRHSQWHQVRSRDILLQRASSALSTWATTGVIVVLEGGDLPRLADLRGPFLPLSLIHI